MIIRYKSGYHPRYKVQFTSFALPFSIQFFCFCWFSSLLTHFSTQSRSALVSLFNESTTITYILVLPWPVHAKCTYCSILPDFSLLIILGGNYITSTSQQFGWSNSNLKLSFYDPAFSLAKLSMQANTWKHSFENTRPQSLNMKWKIWDIGAAKAISSR